MKKLLFNLGIKLILIAIKDRDEALKAVLPKLIPDGYAAVHIFNTQTELNQFSEFIEQVQEYGYEYTDDEDYNSEDEIVTPEVTGIKTGKDKKTLH